MKRMVSLFALATRNLRPKAQQALEAVLCLSKSAVLFPFPLINFFLP